MLVDLEFEFALFGFAHDFGEFLVGAHAGCGLCACVCVCVYGLCGCCVAAGVVVVAAAVKGSLAWPSSDTAIRVRVCLCWDARWYPG